MWGRYWDRVELSRGSGSTKNPAVRMHGSFQVFSSKDKLHCRLNILNFEYLAIYSVTVSWVLARSFKNMSPKTIDDIYADYKGRRTGIIRALAEGEARYPPR